ncbi:hypothetical protein N7492_003370 [Penicillium capsulatum]|uniref:HhH-GPD domain-containing protein n=1 Tax=Penicillium capsulatum TaxID=69766 RepID=A0A9W9LWI7_9EURO|nr:hypothetical protein N7492_003370 [Penicillium capsulatum]KAJ6122046.1 hypothetical protein N7512_004511 [Penicillium capsulatum]
MERRLTRSATRQAAGLPAQVQTVAIDQAPGNPSTTNKRAGAKKKIITVIDAVNPNKKPTQNSQRGSAGRKRSKASPKPALKPAPTEELPHNLGALPLASPSKASASLSGSDKESASVKEEALGVLATEISPVPNIAATEVKAETVISPKKSRVKRNPYGLTPGRTPFPDWARPTSEECEVVNQLLSGVHGEIVAPKTIPEPSLTVTGCGEVPSVLDALIRTLLSGATTGKNSAMAFNGLVQRFGILSDGIGKGSVNWDAVRRASLTDVFEAIKSGGLADIKSKNLKAILDMVHKENQERRDLLVSSRLGVEDATVQEESKPEHPETANKMEKDTRYEIACADQNFLSLNHLHKLPSEEAMTELVKYPGIGPKTAACVILFCLQRPCFAVDTHIFRICKWLGWVPPTRANEVTAFSHLEVRIPDHLKYSLHQLFIRHGKSCPRCRAITGESSVGWDEGCVIDHLVQRTGKRKGSAPSNAAAKKGRATGKRKKNGSSDEESELSELSDLSEGLSER